MQRPLPLTPLSPFGMDGRRQPPPPGCPGGPSLHRPVCTRLIVFRQADAYQVKYGTSRRCRRRHQGLHAVYPRARRRPIYIEQMEGCVEGGFQPDGRQKNLVIFVEKDKGKAIEGASRSVRPYFSEWAQRSHREAPILYLAKLL